MSVSTNESDSLEEAALAAMGALATAIVFPVEIGAVSLRLGKSGGGGGDERTSMELKLWYNSFCNLILAS